MIVSVLVFLISLPLAVYTLAGVYQVIDGANRIGALMQLAFRIVLVALLLELTPAGSRIWIGAAFLLVSALHLSAQLVLRWALTRGHWQTERIE